MRYTAEKRARYDYGSPPVGKSLDDQKAVRLAVGGWLRSLREQAGLSQNDLAACIGMDKYFVSKIEHGKLRIGSERYEAWAQAVHWDAAKFAKEVLARYEPSTFALLFPDESDRSQIPRSSRRR